MTQGRQETLARAGCVVLKDGTVLEGQGFGAVSRGLGEVVFNTSLTGYPEILTDPSYAGQAVVLTQVQVGNYGITQEDLEAGKPSAVALVVRSLPETVSSWRAETSLDTWMAQLGIPGVSGVDTRALVRHLRSAGAMPGVVASFAPGEKPNMALLLEQARTLPPMDGQEWVTRVTCAQPHVFNSPLPLLAGEDEAFPGLPMPKVRPHVVAMDFGAKRNILRLLVGAGFHVTVVPAGTSAKGVLDLKPDGVFLSNGPGDPAACVDMVRAVGGILGQVPVFGICLGHQLMARAAGAQTSKLRFGHRGGNQPVQHLGTGKVHITSQNHGFAVDAGSLPRGVIVSELNLNDGTVEGLDFPEARAFSVQYHPEAAPGPHDTRHHFLAFRHLILGSTSPLPRDAAAGAPA